MPTIYKYQEVGKKKYNTKWKQPILLFDIQTRKEVSNLIGPRTFVYDGFWEEYCEWECENVLEEFSNWGKPLPEHIKCSQKKAPVSNLKTFF